MSKLDGNERWKSKMMLTEHVEQYENRHETKISQRPTTEELTMIRDHIILPHMLTMVQKSLDEIERSTNILKQMYIASTQIIMNKISKDMYEIRRELTKRNIKLIADEHADFIMYQRFICRGYEDRFGITRDLIKAEISTKLRNYINDVLLGKSSGSESNAH